MLLVNNQVLPANANKETSELFPMVDEYKKKVKELRTNFPKGEITLMRVGYPQTNQTGLPEPPLPVFWHMERNDENGVLWSYCKGRPVIQPTGLRELSADDRNEQLGDTILLDINKREDYAFYMMYKSGIVGNLYKVFDPDGDKLKELRKRDAERDVQFAISRGMDENKLRNTAAAWGVDKAFDRDLLLVKDDLEKLVFFLQEKKEKAHAPDNLQMKGITDFLAEIKSEDHLLPKALVQKALDYKKATLVNGQFSLGDIEICTVPFNKKDDPITFIAGHLRHPDNKDKWETFLKEVVDEDFINTGDKYLIRWLSEQVGIPLNQQEAKLRIALLDKFKSQ